MSSATLLTASELMAPGNHQGHPGSRADASGHYSPASLSQYGGVTEPPAFANSTAHHTSSAFHRPTHHRVFDEASMAGLSVSAPRGPGGGSLSSGHPQGHSQGHFGQSSGVISAGSDGRCDSVFVTPSATEGRATSVLMAQGSVFGHMSGHSGHTSTGRSGHMSGLSGHVNGSLSGHMSGLSGHMSGRPVESPLDLGGPAPQSLDEANYMRA
ncbi:hypothetical protein THAOC_13409 [Thalassiosira oceanica]|uniref:Uncharacterized protein n=1 Tax=Thalassiosira oceanica TaxID=159749 RepID=K0SK98_THAOC|nr:hypothetical protein THAOC_13409 [Thalassiosira oceanica]|eukprot:EJK65705.1 hypothetical protein THAOC_13409 [Thalassiosira oceanica]